MSSSTPGPSGGGSANTVTPAAAAAPRKQTPSAPGKLAVSEQLITVTSLVEVLAPLVCAGVNITDATKIGDLAAQLESYLDQLGITSASTMVVMLPTGFRDEKPSMYKTAQLDMKLLTPVVMLYVTKLAQLIQALMLEGLHLQRGITSSCLAIWLSELTHPGKIGAGATGLGTDLSRNAGQFNKLPSFTVAALKDDVVDITPYLDKVRQTFGDHGVMDFLTSEAHCRSQLSFSKTFCSRLLGSVKHNVIHGHLFDEICHIENCAELWVKLQEKLRSSELSTSVMMNHWKTFFSLECDDVDQFLVYHNKLKKTLQKLQDCNSIAVGDDDFLRVFVHRALDIEELKESVKALVKPVKDGTTFMTQLESIKDDCISTHGSVGIQAAGTASAIRSRRADASSDKKKSSAAPKSGYVRLCDLPDLPKNVDNALNPYAFGQMRRWYSLMKKTGKSKAEHEELSSFKWAPDPQRKKQRTTRDGDPSDRRITRRANTTHGSTPNGPPSSNAGGDAGHPTPSPNVQYQQPPLPPAPQGSYGGYGGGGYPPHQGYYPGSNARRVEQNQYYPPQNGGYYPPQGGGPGFERSHDNRVRFSNLRDNSRHPGGGRN